MTTAKSNAGTPGATRGRGLDALFEGATAPSSARSSIDADLAALLDDEVSAAETGRSTVVPATEERAVADSVPSQPPSSPPATPRLQSEAVRTDSIDVPPSAAEAQSQASNAGTEASTTEAQPARQFPTTKRYSYGAVFMDEIPASVTPEQAPSDTLIPVVPGERTVAPPAPGVETIDTTPIMTVERTGDQKTIMISRLDQVLDKNWQRTFHRQIDDLYRQVATEFSSPPASAERAMTLLREARELMVGSPEEYVNAEYRMMQVTAMLDRVKESRKQSVFYGPRILAYEAGWLVLLLIGLVFATPLTNWIKALSGMQGEAVLNINPILNTMFWGGIGGVVGALYALWWHVSETQNFDRHYMMWYMVQPLMGLVLGGITFLILTGGFLILQVDISSDKASVGARLLPYLTAVLAGFRQNFVYEQIERLIALFTPATKKQESGGEGPSV